MPLCRATILKVPFPGTTPPPPPFRPAIGGNADLPRKALSLSWFWTAPVVGSKGSPWPEKKVPLNLAYYEGLVAKWSPWPAKKVPLNPKLRMVLSMNLL